MECIMCDLSNAEIYNRWKFAKKQTAKDYWYDFMVKRAQCGREGAQDTVDAMDAVGNQ
ncbi:hypothetical protein PSYG_00038 [Psychrobacter phage pOW20-A]|uniref:hypothetical protein n=1 Tax=Psychrobacter phage pOW20-A TaxID=754048 RepID=UPI0002C18E85|nr:hypothetical protein PSYG_00038 [Psychrobacter phage pOW20-A]AGH57499.1 hypothetical protein PSYG_00038 [Psychrobacter phage pOW20-A]